MKAFTTDSKPVQALPLEEFEFEFITYIGSGMESHTDFYKVSAADYDAALIIAKAMHGHAHWDSIFCN